MITSTMSFAAKKHTELNPLQISLLRLFDKPMSVEEIKTLKRLLVKHYSAELKQEVTRVVDQKGYTDEDLDKFLNADS